MNNPENDLTEYEAFNIYYKGNNILKLGSDGKFKIDPAFTEGLQIPRFLRTREDVRTYIDLLPKIMFNVATRSKTSMNQRAPESLFEGGC